jgi:hypothetical protein
MDKLYFIYSIDLEKNKYLSVIFDMVHKTSKYRDTCLYTIKELPKVKAILNKEKIDYEIAEATSINIAPHNFRLPKKIIIDDNEAIQIK